MIEIWNKLLELFCKEMNTDMSSWGLIHEDEFGASFQHKATGHVFKVGLG